LINNEVNYKTNHFAFVILLLLIVINITSTLIGLVDIIEYHWQAVVFFVLLGIDIVLSIHLGGLLYGIGTNTTPAELYDSHQHLHLWKKIEYLPYRKILIRTYKNPN
jgi:hypothetical protein